MHVAGQQSNIAGLPAAKSEISGPNFRKFQDNFRTLCQFHEAQDTEKAHFYVLINAIH